MACNGTFLALEVGAMNSRLWQKSKITAEQIRTALGFIIDAEKMKAQRSCWEFPENIKDLFPEDAHYAHFVDLCRDIYVLLTNDETSQMEVILFLELVSQKYRPYYERERRTPTAPSLEEKINLEEYLQKFRARKKKE